MAEKRAAGQCAIYCLPCRGASIFQSSDYSRAFHLYWPGKLHQDLAS